MDIEEVVTIKVDCRSGLPPAVSSQADRDWFIQVSLKRS
jgi:hypothetical protein